MLTVADAKHTKVLHWQTHETVDAKNKLPEELSRSSSSWGGRGMMQGLDLKC